MNDNAAFSEVMQKARNKFIMMLKFNFHIAGIETREEWGTLVKCVKLLTPEREKLFKTALNGMN